MSYISVVVVQPALKEQRMVCCALMIIFAPTGATELPNIDTGFCN